MVLFLIIASIISSSIMILIGRLITGNWKNSQKYLIFSLLLAVFNIIPINLVWFVVSKYIQPKLLVMHYSFNIATIIMISICIINWVYIIISVIMLRKHVKLIDTYYATYVCINLMITMFAVFSGFDF